jgi:hypothetical protein
MVGGSYPAADLVRTYSGGGKTDWFLGNEAEWTELYKQGWKEDHGLSGTYWTSERGARYGEAVTFSVSTGPGTGSLSPSDKYATEHSIRPFRKF